MGSLESHSATLNPWLCTHSLTAALPAVGKASVDTLPCQTHGQGGRRPKHAGIWVRHIEACTQLPVMWLHWPPIGPRDDYLPERSRRAQTKRFAHLWPLKSMDARLEERVCCGGP